MNQFKKIILILLFLIKSQTLLNANEKIAYINMDYIINKSNPGLIILKKLDNTNKKNIDFLKKEQIKLKTSTDEIKKIKNIVSKEELKKKIDIHEKEINKFNQTQNDLSKNFKNLRKKEINVLLKKINPLVEEYMLQNSIEIILIKRSVYSANPSYDITNKILDIVNKKIK